MFMHYFLLSASERSSIHEHILYLEILDGFQCNLVLVLNFLLGKLKYSNFSVCIL